MLLAIDGDLRGSLPNRDAEEGPTLKRSTLHLFIDMLCDILGGRRERSKCGKIIQIGMVQGIQHGVERRLYIREVDQHSELVQFRALVRHLNTVVMPMELLARPVIA